jgi:hypothetical protein
MLGILGVGVIIINFLLCFCNPIRGICCRESIFDHHHDLINRRVIVNDIIEQDEENTIKIISCESLNMDNKNDFTTENNIPHAKEINIVNAENIQII